MLPDPTPNPEPSPDPEWDPHSLDEFFTPSTPDPNPNPTAPDEIHTFAHDLARDLTSHAQNVATLAEESRRLAALANQLERMINPTGHCARASRPDRAAKPAEGPPRIASAGRCADLSSFADGPGHVVTRVRMLTNTHGHTHIEHGDAALSLARRRISGPVDVKPLTGSGEGGPGFIRGFTYNILVGRESSADN